MTSENPNLVTIMEAILVAELISEEAPSVTLQVIDRQGSQDVSMSQKDALDFKEEKRVGRDLLVLSIDQRFGASTSHRHIKSCSILSQRRGVLVHLRKHQRVAQSLTSRNDGDGLEWIGSWREESYQSVTSFMVCGSELVDIGNVRGSAGSSHHNLREKEKVAKCLVHRSAHNDASSMTLTRSFAHSKWLPLTESAFSADALTAA